MKLNAEHIQVLIDARTHVEQNSAKFICTAISCVLLEKHKVPYVKLPPEARKIIIELKEAINSRLDGSLTLTSWTKANLLLDGHVTLVRNLTPYHFQQARLAWLDHMIANQEI